MFRYLADLNSTRVKLLKDKRQNQQDFHNQENSDNHHLVDLYEAAFHNLVGWSHDSYICLPIGDWKLNVVHSCGIGANTAVQIWQWLKLLRWPTEDHEASIDDKGISWFELVVNYAVCLQKLMPIQVAMEGRHVHYAPCPSDMASIQPKHLKSANHQAYSLEKCVRQLEHLSLTTLIPSFPKYKYRPCCSLHALGLTRKVAGIARRPILPMQEETMRLVRQYVLDNKKENSLHAPFNISEQPALVPTSTLIELDPRDRFNKAAVLRRVNQRHQRAQ